jgi:REP element-mobilizing transposase RayT
VQAGALPLAGFAKGGAFRPLVFVVCSRTFCVTPWGRKRFQQARQLHFITFSCYRRQPRLNTPESRRVFERQLEVSRRRVDASIYGYVVMPEHVHLLVNEPVRGPLSSMIQSLKQTVARKRGFDDAHFLAAPLLRLQRLERSQACREASLHAPKSGKAWAGRQA